MLGVRTASLYIRPFNFTDTDYEAIAAIGSTLRPEAPLSPKEIRCDDRLWQPSWRVGRIVCEQDGEIVRSCKFGRIPSLPDPGACFVYVSVRPDRQRQGVGTALYAHATRTIKSYPLTTIRVRVRDDRPGTMRFLAKHGFETLLREPESLLDVHAFDARRFDAGLKGADRAGVTIRSLAELQRVTPDWQQKCSDLEWAIQQDVPQVKPEQPWTLDDYITVFDEPDFDPCSWFIACDDRNWVAMSTLWPVNEMPGTFETGVTGVLCRYRRRGIALMLKLRAIAHVGDRGGVRVRTSNEENNPMLSLNRRLGFVPGPSWVSLEKRFSSVDRNQ